MSCNHSQAQLYLNLVSSEFLRHSYLSTQNPHTQMLLSDNDMCSESSDQVTHTDLSPQTLTQTHHRGREGEASSQTKSQTPSQNQTNMLKICLRQARPNRISVDCVKNKHKGQKGVTWMWQTKLCFTFQTTVWSLKIWM